MKATLNNHEEKMTKTINVLIKDLAAIRAGRANPAVLDKITIEYYGTPTPLNQVAAVATPEPRTLQIQPWDASTLKLIEKAIYASDLGLNPQNDGKTIRLNFPPLTEERRKDLIKQCHKMGEDSKVAVRNIRRDAIDTFKAMKKNNELTEDGQKEAEEKMQKITDKFIKEIDGIIAKKSKELAEV
jgi:ribosome recycling factor